LTFAALMALVAAACTMKKQEAPPLSGPSEFGLSITIEVRPDVMALDGASVATVTVTARDAAGQPKGGQQVRLETIVNGANVDFGTLSSKTVTTGSDGRATATYTAPLGTSNASELLVSIRATPIGGDADSAVSRTASVRLVPQGIVNPPAGLVPSFTFSPTAPVEDSQVLFDATASRGNNAIATYAWNFGNGRSGAGVRSTTTFEDPGSYFVTLTITDELGRSASTTNTVTVVAGVAPTADFVYSPTDPRTGQQVVFDAALSTVPSGRRLVGYNWNFGDGSFGTGPAPAHSYSLARTYTVVLTVTDDTGRTAATSKEVTVVSGSK
jgi:PKD repeat protein